MTLQPTLAAVVVAYVASTEFVMIGFSVAYKKSLIHISETTRKEAITNAVFCL